MARIVSVSVDELYEDKNNPRKPDQARLGLLGLSIRKLGFVMPMYALPADDVGCMLLSGHQRLTVARQLNIKKVPVIVIDIKEKDIKGINILFNRGTNDFNAFDTGEKARDKLSITDVIDAAEKLPDFVGERWPCMSVKDKPIRNVGSALAARYDKKATVLAKSILDLGIRIPIVVSESGDIVNGVHRLFAAREAGFDSWPTITVPDSLAKVALNFLNYLSMDFHVDDEFEKLLRFSAYRRPQNNRGNVPKAYRFWANGNRTLPDKDSYSVAYWRKFRDIHGVDVVDFGAGLCKVKPYLEGKGMRCTEFEPYRIDPGADNGVPSPEYSRRMARVFLDEVADGRKFTSVFLASVLNSIPFPKDRMAVLAIVHALCDKDTVVYGTCRDISDFNYEYGGIRNANYFVFDSEPGVRIGDVMRNPKIQKFHTQEEADNMLKRLWTKRDFWPGGNVFYWRAANPMKVNTQVLRQALDIEFDKLPYSDGSAMGLGPHAAMCFSKRLGVEI